VSTIVTKVPKAWVVENPADGDVILNYSGGDLRKLQIINATKECLGRFGLTKTSVDDIAKESGLSRATIYRYFPGGKDQILRSLLFTEVINLKKDIAQAVSEVDDLTTAILVVMKLSFSALKHNRALSFILTHEPEAIVSYLSFENAERLYLEVGSWGEDIFGKFTTGDSARRLMEWLARVILSYFVAPNDSFDFLKEDDLCQIVESFILPGLNFILARG
jgi:AcrR family transcriptional regulator